MTMRWWPLPVLLVLLAGVAALAPPDPARRQPEAARPAPPDAGGEAAALLQGRGPAAQARGGLPEPTAQAPASLWRAWLPRLDGLDEAARATHRQAASAALALALHPSAPYRGGSDALRAAARLADVDLRDRLLDVLAARDHVELKLPLTEERDDLVLIDAVAGAVLTGGSAGQRARLASLLAAALAEEDEETARARLASWAMRGGGR